jgi:uncharacterized protein YciI
MKAFVFTFCLLISFFGAAESHAQYDSVLARKLGADAYGMKQYVMALLHKGPAVIKDTAKLRQLLGAHLKNIGRLADEGKMVLAGPMMDQQNLEGIFIFNVKTVKEAEALSATDPAVQAGIFSLEFHPWYASAALMQVVDTHKKLQKQSF